MRPLRTFFEKNPASNEPAGEKLYFVNQQEYSILLLLTESGPTVQKLLLGSGKRDNSISLCEKLRQRNTKCAADLFQRGDGRNHVFAIPGGDGRLGQTGMFR